MPKDYKKYDLRPLREILKRTGCDYIHEFFTNIDNNYMDELAALIQLCNQLALQNEALVKKQLKFLESKNGG